MLTSDEKMVFVRRALENAENGISLTESSRALGVSYTTLRRWIVAAGEDIPVVTSARKIDRAKVKEMAAGGCSYAFIAREFGVSRERIRQVCTDGYVKTKCPRRPPISPEGRYSKQREVLRDAEERGL